MMTSMLNARNYRVCPITVFYPLHRPVPVQVFCSSIEERLTINSSGISKHHVSFENWHPLCSRLAHKKYSKSSTYTCVSVLQQYLLIVVPNCTTRKAFQWPFVTSFKFNWQLSIIRSSVIMCVSVRLSHSATSQLVAVPKPVHLENETIVNTVILRSCYLCLDAKCSTSHKHGYIASALLLQVA